MTVFRRASRPSPAPRTPPAPPWVALGLLLTMVGAGPVPSAVASPADSTGTTRPAPLLIDVPAPVVADTIRVRRKALSIREIVERCIEGERTKLAGRRSMTYTTTFRAVVEFDDRRLVSDSVMRSYAEASGFERNVELGETIVTWIREDGAWVIDEDAEEEEDGVEVSSEGVNDFEDLPLFFEEVQEFDFELRDRFVQSDHVIFEVGFRPKSEFKPLPSGTLYIDTNRYRIIHEELSFERNPFPLLIHDLKNLSRQWTELPTGEWVFTRIRGEVELRALPFGVVPEKVSFVMERSDFDFDVDYDEAVFGER